MSETPASPIPDADEIHWDDDGLVPTVIQDASTDAVLMIGFLNRESLAATRESGLVHYWSRSRGQLWQKGGTSGHVQRVREIRINCEQNSLLIVVDQEGAVCHDGYASCFYRRLEPEGELTTVLERQFDPARVYGEGLDQLTKQQMQVYAYLRDQVLGEVSGTSRLLRTGGADVGPRIGDELRELVGVLDGSHRHREFREDVLLESGQVVYWALLEATRAGVSWDELRPDRALQTASDDLGRGSLIRLLVAEAERWSAERGDVGSADLHALLALIGQTLASCAISPREVVRHDLEQMRTRPYLAEFFTATAR